MSAGLSKWRPANNSSVVLDSGPANPTPGCEGTGSGAVGQLPVANFTSAQ